MLAAAGVAPRIVSRLGLYATSVFGLLAVSACILAIGVLDNYWAWLPLRFITGFLLSCIFVVTDTWVNQLVEDRFRGRAIGVYSMLLSVGFAVGPAILTLLGTGGFAPYAVGALLPLLAVLPLFFARHRLTSTISSQQPTSILSFVRRAPTILVCVAAAAFADQAAMSLLPIYAVREGLRESEASLSVTIMILGSVTCMYPIGWLADVYSRAKVVIWCAVLTAVLSALLLFTTGTMWQFFSVIFAWGGIYYAIYSLALIKLGEQYSGADLVAGNAACSAMWGIGGILGTPLAGVAMQSFGPAGFPTSMAVAFTILSLGLLTVSKRSADER
jgi:MFS family permease